MHFQTTNVSRLAEAWSMLLTTNAGSKSRVDSVERGSVSCAVSIELVAAAQNGDQDAYREIVDVYQTPIATQMQRFARSGSEVEELVQEVFVEAYFSLHSFKAKSPFLHWLRKIAVRVGYRHWKQKAQSSERHVPMDLVQEEVATAMAAKQTEPNVASKLLHQVFEVLEPRDRLVLTLLYWDNYSVAETAQLTGWTKTMVKVQAHRARKRLGTKIEEAKNE